MLMNAWASTLPGNVANLPHAGDPCAVKTCTYALVDGEEVYYTVQMPGQTGRGLAVCWRHVERENTEPHPVNPRLLGAGDGGHWT